MTKNKVVPGFLKNTANGWRVDTDDPSWENLLVAKRGQSPATNAVKRAGARIISRGKRKTDDEQLREKSKKEEINEEEEDEETIARKEQVNQAVRLKVICNAKREKLKMQQDEIKTEKMKGAFVDRDEGLYWLSFMQRGITDSFSTVDRCFAEMKRLILLGQEREGRQYLKSELKRGFETVSKNMREAAEATSND
jgi:hypothetical protein